MSNKHGEVTVLLGQVRQGDRDARDQLYRLVEDELRKIAQHKMRSERPDHTLQTTILTNDVFLKLVGAADIDWHDRSHFYRTAARAMRRLLVDHQRARQTEKRGGGRERTAVELPEIGKEQFQVDLLALDEALEKLVEMDPRQSEIVELHHFGGHTLDETAKILDVSTATVKREWTAAKAWLHMRLSDGDSAT